MSPGSGEFYTTVNLGDEAPGRGHEEEGTSETNAYIREEVRATFEMESHKHQRAEAEIK